MDLWVKAVWALAAVVIVASLVALGRSAGTGGGPASASATPEYFTIQDPARSTVEYGVHQDGRTVIYSSVVSR